MWKNICALFVSLWALTSDTRAADCYSEFCHTKLSNETNDGPQCLITPIQHGVACMNMKFDSLGHIPPYGVPLTNLKLSAYVYSSGSQKVTAFNLTAEDITFNRLITRYQNLGDSAQSHCRDIRMLGLNNSRPNPNLFVSCPFVNTSFETVSYRLEYLIAGEGYKYSRKFIFNVPDHINIDENVRDVKKYTLFAYADVSDTSMLSLYIQPLPEKFNITNYRVWAINNDTETVEVVDLLMLNSKDHIQHNFSVSEGIHYFYISAMHPTCGEYGCINSTLPAISTRQPTRRLLIMIISVVWIPPVILYGIYYMYKLYRKKDLLKRIGRRPNCLLVYSPTHMTHVNVVSNLTKYLRSCNIDAMVDVLDIPETVTKDPGQWCNEAFKSADTIVVVTSPALGNASVPIIYRNMDNHALRLLKENYSLRNKRYLVLELPYCKSDEIPEEARLFKKFKVPEHLDKLIKYLHNVDFIRFFGVSSKILIESINLAMFEVSRERQGTPKNVDETDGLLPASEKTILNVEEKKTCESNIDNLTDDTEPRYYTTNIDELNLLGEGKETQEEIKFRPPVNDGEFHIDQLNL